MGERQYLNLYQGFEPQPLFGRNLLLLLAALLLGLLLLLAQAYWLHAQVRALETSLAELDAQSHLRQKEMVALGLRLKGDAGDPLAALEQQRRIRERLVRALTQGELGRMAGFADYLNALTHQTGTEVWLTGFAVSASKAGVEVSLAGRGRSGLAVASYLTKLKQETVFQGVAFAAMDVKQPEGGETVQSGDRKSEAKAGDKPAVRPEGVSFTLGKPLERAAKEAP